MPYRHGFTGSSRKNLQTKNRKMITLKETIKAIETEWISAPSLEIYLSNCYKQVFNFCAAIYDFNEKELKVYKRYKFEGSETILPEISTADMRYLFILLCAAKNAEILELLNFTVLPTDIRSFTNQSILREIEITKGLI